PPRRGRPRRPVGRNGPGGLDSGTEKAYQAATSRHQTRSRPASRRNPAAAQAPAVSRKGLTSSAACWVLRETEHCPPSWVEAFQLAGSSGYWVGHSSERFAAELTSD